MLMMMMMMMMDDDDDDDDDVVVDDEGLDLESDDKNLIEECTELGRRVMDKSCIETLIITLGEYTYLKIHEF